jgi:hypothetical protein
MLGLLAYILLLYAYVLRTHSLSIYNSYGLHTGSTCWRSWFIWEYVLAQLVHTGVRVGAVGSYREYVLAQLVQALRYKPEGSGFDSRWVHWDVSVT